VGMPHPDGIKEEVADVHYILWPETGVAADEASVV